MANTFKVLFRGAAAVTSQTLYTVPSATTTLVTTIVVANTAGTDATYDLSLGGVSLGNDVSVPANDSVILEIKQVMDATDAIEGLASATTVNFHISGLEIA